MLCLILVAFLLLHHRRHWYGGYGPAYYGAPYGYPYGSFTPYDPFWRSRGWAYGQGWGYGGQGWGYGGQGWGYGGHGWGQGHRYGYGYRCRPYGY